MNEHGVPREFSIRVEEVRSRCALGWLGWAPGEAAGLGCLGTGGRMAQRGYAKIAPAVLCVYRNGFKKTAFLGTLVRIQHLMKC